MIETEGKYPKLIKNEIQPFLLPLSTPQRGQWMGQKIGPKNATYNLSEYVEINGSIDIELFSAASRQLILEADTTRCFIVEQGDEVFQKIEQNCDNHYAFVDFSTSDDAHEAALEWMREDIHRPLDPTRDPLWFSALIKINSDRYYWYQRCHHVSYDGFSGGMLARRLSQIYSEMVAGQEVSPSPFGPLSMLVESEQEYRQSSRFQRDREYWMETLSHLPDAVSLAQRLAPSNGGLLRKTLYLSQALTEKIKAVGQQAGGSLPQTLISLVAAYYYRATGVDDLVFGMPVTARTSKELRSVPGMMANAVPIRLAMGSDITLEQLIQQVGKVMRSALRHQRYRYEDLRRDLGLMANGRQISWLGINIEPFDYDLRFGECSTSLHNMCNGAIEDLTIFVYDRNDGQGLRVDLDANPARYSESELITHMQRLERLVLAIIKEPQQSLSKASLLSAAERHQILHDWNKSTWPVPKLSVVDLFDAQVMCSPWEVAVTTDEESLTYMQLNRLANAWARTLIETNVLPGDLVAVACNRDTNMLVALLAVLKAGAAYLPLDPDFPEERLKIILEDAQPKLLLSSEDLVDSLPTVEIPTLWLNNPDFDPAAPEHGVNPVVPFIEGDSPAYVIYTSGSTGRPKGVEIPHRAFTNFLCAMQGELKLTPDDCFLAVTTISFDIAALELFLPIVVGASVLIAERKVVRNPEALVDMVTRHGATVMQATPSLWQALLPDYSKALHGIRTLVGGEALSGPLARMMAGLGHPVINVYGPTETTIWSTIMTLSNPADIDYPPIGRPIWNTQVYVLDQTLEPVPVGVTGDLYIAGDGLALGYYRRPDLTNERFVSNPFGQPGSRMYFTGDKARWRDDGVLEYQGRSDHQVKIRGFRIEIGEIETRLLACREVNRCVVVAQTAPQGSQQLVAYVVPVDEKLNTDDLRRQLLSNLPDYMIPTHFMLMEQLPLTPNGKIDRKALPLPVWHAARSYVPPRTPAEEMVASIWAETLGLEKVGIYDNFFEIGGDSISATKILNRINETMAIDVPLSAMFTSATIADLTDQLRRDDSWDPLGVVLPIKTDGTAAPLFCIHPAIGLSWAYAGMQRHLPVNTPLYGLQSQGLRHAVRLPKSIEEMAEDYLEHIRRVQPKGPYRLLGWSFGGMVAHALAQRLQTLGEEVSFLCMLDTYPYLFGPDIKKDSESMVKAALAFLGYNPATLSEQPKDMTELAAFLVREYDIPSMPMVQEMQKNNADIIDHVLSVIQNNLDLARRFRPGYVESDLLFFVAEESMHDSMKDILDHRAEAWKSSITGELKIHSIKCMHQEIMDVEVLNEVGPIIAEHLGQ
ncbi:amino acid adenylation domain-containing protein [Gynuella sp.]|uniref:amino acid adenylation domain-containing protein n=1 Tax=Gynuella sp. TaxID=2969146 RepID=UPI003D0A2D8E